MGLGDWFSDRANNARNILGNQLIRSLPGPIGAMATAATLLGGNSGGGTTARTTSPTSTTSLSDRARKRAAELKAAADAQRSRSDYISPSEFDARLEARIASQGGWNSVADSASGQMTPALARILAGNGAFGGAFDEYARQQAAEMNARRAAIGAERAQYEAQLRELFDYNREDPWLVSARDSAKRDAQARLDAAIPSIGQAFQRGIDSANQYANEATAQGKTAGAQMATLFQNSANQIAANNAAATEAANQQLAGIGAAAAPIAAQDIAAVVAAAAPREQALQQQMGEILAGGQRAMATDMQQQSAAEQTSARNMASLLQSQADQDYLKQDYARRMDLRNQLASALMQAGSQYGGYMQNLDAEQRDIARMGLEQQTRADEEAKGIYSDWMLQEFQKKNQPAYAGSFDFDNIVQPYVINDPETELPISTASTEVIRTIYNNAELAKREVLNNGGDALQAESAYRGVINAHERDFPGITDELIRRRR